VESLSTDLKWKFILSSLLRFLYTNHVFEYTLHHRPNILYFLHPYLLSVVHLAMPFVKCDNLGLSLSYIFHILDLMCMLNVCKYLIFTEPTKDRNVKRVIK